MAQRHPLHSLCIRVPFFVLTPTGVGKCVLLLWFCLFLTWDVFKPLTHLGQNSQLLPEELMLQDRSLLEKGGPRSYLEGRRLPADKQRGSGASKTGNLWDTDQRWLLWSRSILREKDLESLI